MNRLQTVVNDTDGILEIIKLNMQWLKRMHRVEQRCRRFQVVVPHPGADLDVGAVVVPEKKAGTETVSVVQPVIIPDLPDALRVHGSDELTFTGVVLNSGGFTVTADHVIIKGCNQVEPIAVQVVPGSLVYRPQFVGRHHLL